MDYALYYRPKLNIRSHWCRYCGARYSCGYNKGPWGPNTLCTRHYTQYKKGGIFKLELEKYILEPVEPIKPEENKDERSLMKIIKKDQKYH